MQIIILRKNQTINLQINPKKIALCGILLSAGMAGLIYWAMSTAQATQPLAQQQKHPIPAQEAQFYQQKLGEMQAKMVYLDQLIQNIKEKIGQKEQQSLPPSSQSKSSHLNHDAKENQATYKLTLNSPELNALSNLTQKIYPYGENKNAQGGADIDIKNFEMQEGFLNQGLSSENLIDDELLRKTISEAEQQAFMQRLATDIDIKTQEMQYVQSMLYAQEYQKFDILPVQNARLTSGFGWRYDPIGGRKSMHTGQDFSIPTGTAIYSVQAGVVVASEYHRQYGYMMDIDHGDGLKTRYAHCSRLLLNVGEVVQKGTQIAYSGSTGKSTGPHLHFEVRIHDQAIDPKSFLET